MSVAFTVVLVIIIRTWPGLPNLYFQQIILLSSLDLTNNFFCIIQPPTRGQLSATGNNVHLLITLLRLVDAIFTRNHEI